MTVTACSIALGPLAALAYEGAALRVFSDLVHDLWLVVILALGGVGLGMFGIMRRQRVLGTISLVCNLAVAALYGYIGAFFAFGGSR